MPVAALPDFEHVVAIAGGTLDALELAECHGAACGLLCRHPDSVPDTFLNLLTTLELINDPEPVLTEQLAKLHAATVSQMEDEQLRLKLWLPDDDEPLEDRSLALAHWCTGFLAGLGSGHDSSLDTLSEDLEGALKDLEQLARAEVMADGDEEEEEVALVEIIEYIRVVTFMFKAELRPAADKDRLH